MIYTDRQYEIHRLSNNARYRLIAEVYKEDGRLIAGLFEFTEDLRCMGKTIK